MLSRLLENAVILDKDVKMWKVRGGANMRNLTFSPKKAIETLLYIAQRLERPTIHEVLKIQYFADKLHAQDYGFMPSGDEYVAMKFGPVGSATYDIIKAARGDVSKFNKQYVPFVEGAIEVKGEDDAAVRALREPDIEYLSRAQIRCIDRAVELYGNMPFSERTELSHDNAWTEAWNEAKAKSRLQSPMARKAILSTLSNSHEIFEHINT